MFHNRTNASPNFFDSMIASTSWSGPNNPLERNC
jgi:hypothetical protein